ncbi:hypothetical protein [Streptomyces sp. QHH-9511]|uniref:hypothetical protein n=1 Tax=Streptomyces sp. QHH-9511 TaxID=2684468 RepID=UPI001E5CAB27|nr:hypothetical protein [Streptomyces sp. QHH-9511]
MNRNLKAAPDDAERRRLYVLRPVAKMLDWFIRHHPESAHHCIGDIAYEAHNRWNVPAEDTLYTLNQALALDGKLSTDDRDAFFSLLTPPEKQN